MFGRIGVSELLIILVVVLIFFGPAKLPALAKSMGQAVSEFRKGTKEISKELEEISYIVFTFAGFYSYCVSSRNGRFYRSIYWSCHIP